MPHTNRKKKNPDSHTSARPRILHTKRQQVEDDDGWTHVIETPRRVPRTDSAMPENPWLQGGDFVINTFAYVNRTLDEMTADFEHYRKQWESTEACQTLISEIKLAQGERGLVVTNVVCLGLGSLQAASSDGRRTSHTQLAALGSIISALGIRESLPCFAQDPIFTAMDKEFLTSLGYTVVENPSAFKLVDNHSLVYAIHCYVKIYVGISIGPRPAALVGRDVKVSRTPHQKEGVEDEEILKKMVEEYEELDFPQVRFDFSDTKIYLRKSAASLGV